MAKIYNNTGRLHPRRSAFDLSYSIIGTTDIGYIFPVCCKHMAPGDIFEYGHEMVIRFQPLINPILHEINAYTWTFFVPFRLIDENWEDFVCGGWDGRHLPNGTDPISIPKWSGSCNTLASSNIKRYTLYDALGFSHLTNEWSYPDPEDRNKMLPVDYPLRAYNFIYNEYFRDENLEPEIEYPYDRQAVINANSQQPGYNFYRFSSVVNPAYNNPNDSSETNLFWGNWEKDYFTTALPWQQRGPSPALPLYGTADLQNALMNISYNNLINYPGGQVANTTELGLNYATPPLQIPKLAINPQLPTTDFDKHTTQVLLDYIKNNNSVTGKVNLSSATAGDINDLRWGFQLQKFMERNARIGIRYVEILHGRYGQPLQDVRLNRPEYIGGSKTPIIISEVLQTSESNTTSKTNLNQTGSMRGHGISADKNFIKKYHAREFGCFMTLMCIKPRAAYNSQGTDREWNFTSPFDLITPEFVNLSERTTKLWELYLSPFADNDERSIGFQGRYDEFRTSHSKTCGLMRSDLRSWHMARDFTDPPELTAELIKINPNDSALRRPFAVTSQHGIIYHFQNIIKGIRPLPIIAEPGLIDHH